VTSLIRSAAQENDVVEAGARATPPQGQPQAAGIGKLDVLVEDLAAVQSESDAARILDRVGANWVVWSAGAFASSLSLLLSTFLPRSFSPAPRASL
jgi:hypothetical protein